MSQSSPQQSVGPASGPNLFRIISNLKLRNAIFILIILAAFFYFLHFVKDIHPLLSFFDTLFLSLADGCLTSAVVGFAFERLVRRESQEELKDLLKHQLEEQRKAYLSSLPHALLLDKNVQQQLVKETKLDEVILTALESKFGDHMGKAVYHGVLHKATAFKEFRRNYRHEIFVSRVSDPNVPLWVQQEFFDVITQVNYETTLQKDKFLFACVDTQDQFNQLLQSAEYEDIWVSPPNEALQSPVFELQEISVDEVKLNMVSPKRDGHSEVVCEHPSLATKMNRDVTVRYSFKTRAEKIGHVIHITVNYPTYDVTIEFTFGNSSIDWVDVLDYFVSSRTPSIHSIPDEKKPSKYSVRLRDWVFPKGGVAFVWSLKEEDDSLQQRRGQSQ
jgi:hypothetical protein